MSAVLDAPPVWRDKRIILGSSSRWRRQVAEERGLPVAKVVAPDIDEQAIRDPDPERLVMLIAHAKADACIKKLEEQKDEMTGILLSSDQVCLCGDEIREKPIDDAEARRFLRSYNEQPARLVNGFVAVDLATKRREEGIFHAAVYYKDLSEEVINRAINNSQSVR
eukprot:Selendium_serpulae@DN1937_c1_g1_i1.p1